MLYNCMQRSPTTSIFPYTYIQIDSFWNSVMVMRSKKILRLWLWWAPQQQRRPPALPLKEGFQDHSTENSRESLLASQYLCQWNLKEVPRGFLAVYVGPELRRFVIPTSYLSMPDFRALMERMADEFEFKQEGGLQIPCEEEDFQEILGKCLTRHKMKNTNKKKHKGVQQNWLMEKIINYQ